MLKGTRPITPPSIAGGLVTYPNFFVLQPGQTPNSMNVEFDIGGVAQKRFGVNSMNTTILVSTAATGFSPDSSGSLSTGLEAYWRMDETSGERADLKDGYNLSVQGTGALVSTGGILGNAAYFRLTSSQYLSRANTAGLQTGDIDFSLAGWFFISTTGEMTIAAKRGGVANVSTSNMVAYWKLEEASSTRFDSFSTNNLTPVTSSDASVTVGRINSAAVLARSSGTVLFLTDNAASSLSFTTNTSYTISAWVYLLTNTASMAILSKGNVGTVEKSWALYYNSGAVSAFRLWVDDSTSSTKAGSADAVAFGVPGTNTWIHVLGWWDQDSDTCNIQINNGTVNSASYLDGITDTVARPILLGAGTDAGFNFDGRIDEVAVWRRVLTASERSNLYNGGQAVGYPFNAGNNYEYWLYVNSNNILTFRVSSSGTVENGIVTADSFGAVSTGTYYFVSAMHDSVNNRLTAQVNTSVNTASYSSGVLAGGSAEFAVGSIGGGDKFMNGAVDELGFWRKVLTAQERTDLYNSGTGNQYSKGASNSGFGSFNFVTTNSIHWLVVAAGTGVFASSNQGIAFQTIATDRTSNYQNFEFSRGNLLMASEARNQPLIWPGSSGTYATALAVNSAPACKYARDFVGFTMLFNSATRPRGVFYEDNNNYTTSAWTRNFDLPGSQGDEITDVTTLKRNIYASTRDRVYRISPAGGFPDFVYREVISNWGYVPRTVERVTVPEQGEVLIGLCHDGRVRKFDGQTDEVLSDPIEQDNGLFPAPLSKLNRSKITKGFSEFDSNKQIYDLWVVMSPSTEVTHRFRYNIRTSAWMCDDAQPYNTAVMATSMDNTARLMSVGRNGFVYITDSGNTDNGVGINEYYDSSFFYGRAAKTAQKSHRFDFYFAPESSGALYFSERTAFDKAFRLRDTIVMGDTRGVIEFSKSLDIPTTQDVYQYRISSSGGTARPWRLHRADFHIQDMGVGDA